MIQQQNHHQQMMKVEEEDPNEQPRKGDWGGSRKIHLLKMNHEVMMERYRKDIVVLVNESSRVSHH